MEAEGYREALAFIESKTDKTILTATEVAALTGLDVRTVRDRFGIGKSGIFITQLARKLIKI